MLGQCDEQSVPLLIGKSHGRVMFPLNALEVRSPTFWWGSAGAILRPAPAPSRAYNNQSKLAQPCSPCTF